MHHIFITNALSVYMVVFSFAEDPDTPLSGEDAASGMTQLQMLHFWLNHVHAQAPQAPIFVVGTHCRSVPPQLQESRRQRIVRSFEGTAFYGQVEAGDVTSVDSKEDSQEVFVQLRERLKRKQGDLEGFHR
jgi:hypothetical protein